MKSAARARIVATILVVAASVFGAGSASAQALVDAAGGNPTLQSVGSNIVSICPRIQVGSTGDLADLAQRCTAAVRAANAGDTATAKTALGQIAPDELISQDAQISGSVQPQTQALSARIAALGGAGAARQISAGLTALPFMQAAATDAVAGPTGRTGRWDGFATGSYSWGDQDTTDLQTGFDAKAWSLLVGGDYQLRNNLILGAALGYANTQIDFSAGQGDLQNDAWTVAGYGSWNTPTGLYASGVLAYSWIDYDSNRRIQYLEPARAATGTSPALPAVTVNRTASGSTNARQYEASGQAGYTFNRKTVSYGPSFGVAYRKLEIDGFSESGAQGLDMSYQDQNTDSLQFDIAGDVTWRASTSFGVVSPYARVAYVYEALDDKRTINTFYRVDPFVGTPASGPVIRVQTAEPDRSRFVVGGGVNTQFAHGLSGFVDFQTVVGQENVSSYGLALGLRREF